MKRNTNFLAFAVCAFLATFGCGSKESPQNATATSNTNNAAPEKTGGTPPANAAKAPSDQGSENESETGNLAQGGTNPSGSQGSSNTPSFPSFGGTAEPGSQSAGSGEGGGGGPRAASVSSGGGGGGQSQGANPGAATGGGPRAASLSSGGGSGGGTAGAQLGSTGAQFGNTGPTTIPPDMTGGNTPGFNPSLSGTSPGATPGATPPNDNPFQDPANALPPTLSLRDRAINSFKGGNVPRAYGLYQSHLLSLPKEEREAEMQNLRWDKKRIVPRLGYSFAVGLVVNNTSKQEKLRPVGTKKGDFGAGQAGSTSGPGGGAGFPGGAAGLGLGSSGGTGGSNAASGLPQLPAKDLSDAAGKYATVFVEAFGKAHTDGKWSQAFRDYEFGSPMTTLPSPAGFSGAAMPGAGGPSGPPTGFAGSPPAGGIPGLGAGGPPAGYTGGPGAGAPPGYNGGGGPPAGYTGGGGGAPPGYKGGGGPPAGYTGGPAAGAPPGYGGGGARGAGDGGNEGAPSPAAGGRSSFRFLRPQEQAGGSNTSPGAGLDEVPSGAAAGPGNAGAPGFGAPSFGSSNPPPPPMDPTLAKDLGLPADTIPLTSGLSYIGKGDNLGELSKKAIQQNYDALIVFEVDVSLLRVNNSVKNDCRIRVVNLRADKESKEKMISGTSLNNQDVASEKDPDARIEKSVDSLLKKLFEAYPLEELPNFKAESITGRRLKDLVNDKVRNKLDLLTEVELYSARGLIDDTLKTAAFERIAGPEGKALSESQPEDRTEILEKLLKRQFD